MSFEGLKSIRSILVFIAIFINACDNCIYVNGIIHLKLGGFN